MSWADRWERTFPRRVVQKEPARFRKKAWRRGEGGSSAFLKAPLELRQELRV